MKSVGEAMAFGRTFKEALQKAIRSLEQGRYGLGADGKDAFDVDLLSEEDKRQWRDRVMQRLRTPRSDNIFFLRYAMQLGVSVDDVHAVTKIDPWFLHNIRQIVEMENTLKQYAFKNS